ncbi:IQ calmodulin-binding motif family protein [Tritrichomonas foetus]|uniref:IQ calmodulin-binding motif family protein n=1 Tax=Tritrichomonas foetus TaxID=1144522 RepID=A0A1J4KIS1_9EUKA|nr:IQ calmodulin-binding motif family protein [Tritrichomonas foetus]|eukprot:OHT09582.1 IQ calmodulin-binding motif family protein [Tritrichomonas foetus]
MSPFKNKAPMSKSPYTVVHRFLLKLFRQQKFHENVVRQQSAIKIQRAFRNHLKRKETTTLYINQCAQKIQRRFRKFQQDLRNNEARRNYFNFRLSQVREQKMIFLLNNIKSSLKQSGSSNEPRKRKTIIDLPQPWTQKKKNTYSQRQIEDFVSNQISDLKWVKQWITPKFTKKIFFDIKNRDEVRERNNEFMERYVSKTFYTFVNRSIHSLNPIISTHFHESTFRIFAVHTDGLSVIKINKNYEDTVEYFHIEFPILDSAMDKRCGRIIVLLKNWTMASFENGFFTKPRKLYNIPKPVLPQKKYIIIDKFGQIFLILTQKYNTVYYIDSLCFSLMSSFSGFSFYASGKISAIYPIYARLRPIGFFATCNSSSQFYIFDEKENRTTTINDHSKFTPNFYVNSNFVFTYAADKKVFVYKRTILSNEQKLTLLTKYEFSCIPTCLVYIKGMSLLIIGFADSTVRFFTFSHNDNHNLTIPYSSLPNELQPYAKDVIGTPKTTNLYTQYNCILTKRVAFKPVNIHSTYFGNNNAFIVIQLGTNQVSTFWLHRKNQKLKCSCFDTMNVLPILMNPSIYASKKAEMDFNAIFDAIMKTRNQLEIDGKYIKLVGREFEKRILASTFMKRSSENAVSILFQSPYNRWLRWLEFCNKTNVSSYRRNENPIRRISIYEVFSLVSKFDVFVPSLYNVETFNMFLIESMPEIAISPVGPFYSTIGTTFSIDELAVGFDILHAVIGAQFTDYQSLKTVVLSLELTIPSIQLKAAIRDFNDLAILRLIEIENIVKNKLRDISLKQSIEELLGSNNARNKRERNQNSYYTYQRQNSTPKKTASKIPKIIPERYIPPLNNRIIKKSQHVLPNPLLEAYRFKDSREVSVQYCSYGRDYPAARLITYNCPICLPNDTKSHSEETIVIKSMAKLGMTIDLLAVSDDKTQFLYEYPLNYVPFNYILSYNQFKCGLPRTVRTAFLWLSKLLIIMASAHKANIVIRSLIPENILVSNDGFEVIIHSLSEFAYSKSPFKTVSYERKNTPWLPPEYWAQKAITQAFDIYQFGILLVVVLTGFVPSSFGEIIATHLKFRNEDAMEIAKSQKFFYDPLDGFPYSEFPFFAAKNFELETLLQITSKSSLLEVAVACLDIDPIRRPTAKQLLDLPFFKLSPQTIQNAGNIGYSLIRKIPLPIFTEAFFTSLLSMIEKERNEDPRDIPTLETAIDIINFFINKNSSGIKLEFPIDEGKVNEVTDEIFKQDIFEKILGYVMGRLQINFEYIIDIKTDIPFKKVHQIFQISILNPNVAKSFIYFCTGMSGNIDSHRLFCFLHNNLRKMVEYFFQNATKEVKHILGISEFYSSHFLQFYDNSRDFAEAYEDQSERRHAAALNFFSTFIDNYPNAETMRLLIDFKIQHKIEHSLCFSGSIVRIAALELCIKVLTIPNFDDQFFMGYLFHSFPVYLMSGKQPYEEKMTMLCVIRDVLFSKSVPAIISLLSSGILHAIADCMNMKLDKNSPNVWGQETEFPVSTACYHLLCEICEKGITSVIKVIFTDEELLSCCLRNGVVREFGHKEYDVMIGKLRDKNFVDDSLLTTLLITENSSLATIAAVTCQSQQSFENSINEICLFLIRIEDKRYKYDQLYQSVLKIWHFHGFEINEKLIKAIIEGITKNYEGHIEMAIETLQILQMTKLPLFFGDFPKVWYEQIHRSYDQIQEMINRKSIDLILLDRYKNDRKQRLRFLKTLITHPDNGISVDFITQCNFASYLLNEMLFNDSKFEIKLKVVPETFSKYNNTYPIRSEGIIFLRTILNNKAKCNMMFRVLTTKMHECDILKRENELLERIDDFDFRKSSVQLFKVLNDPNDSFQINEALLKSNALRKLKEIALDNWEDIEMRRGVLNLDVMKKNSEAFSDIQSLYDSFIW